MLEKQLKDSSNLFEWAVPNEEILMHTVCKFLLTTDDYI